MPKKQKYLIINADDFGLDDEINRGIVQACQEGIVTSVSLVACGTALPQALASLRSLPEIGCGVHLCLTDEQAVLPSSQIPSLVNSQKKFPPNIFNFLTRLGRRALNLNEIERELTAQLALLSDHGVHPSHLDSHQYIHLLPEILPITIKLAKKFNISWIRYPSLCSDSITFYWKGMMKKAWLSLFSKKQLQLLKANDILIPDYTHAFYSSGNLDHVRLRAILQNIKEGVNDMTCHPGFLPHNTHYGEWKFTWKTEMLALTDASNKTILSSYGIELTNYASKNIE